MRRIILATVALAALAACGDAVSPQRYAPQQSTGLRLLGTEAEGGFARATEPREFVFPADHGSHAEFRTEWWYFTGNLATAQGRHFGFELTFFRYAIAPVKPRSEGASAWRADQVWMAHFAVTDTQGKRFIARERLTREALGLAGAAAEPLHVWVEDWSVTGEGRDDALRVDLAASDDMTALSLRLVSTVPHVAQGERGLDAKGAGSGNASLYYSMPRLAAEGQVTVAGERFDVTGLAFDGAALTPALYDEMLARITAPVTVVYGDGSRAGSESARAAGVFARLDARRVVLPGGHNLHFEAPDALAALIAECPVTC